MDMDRQDGQDRSEVGVRGVVAPFQFFSLVALSPKGPRPALNVLGYRPISLQPPSGDRGYGNDDEQVRRVAWTCIQG